MQVYTVGWVDFGLFSLILWICMLFVVPLVTILYRESPNLFNFGSKTNERYHFKGPYFQKMQGAKYNNQKLSFWKIDS